MKFLNRVAGLIKIENPSGFEKVAVIFPSIRAGLFFKHELGKLIGKPFFSPNVFSIEDFASKIANIFPVERLKLIFELYKIYKKHFDYETFDSFYNWGNILLKDFDDIDKNLVPAEKFFRVIKDYKAIDENFAPELEDYKSYKSFWETFSNEPISEHKTTFTELWEKLFTIYSEFILTLKAKKTGYSGMIFREAAGIVSDKKFNSGYERIYFAGFNYITKSETAIIRILQKCENACLLWDADDYYLNAIPGHEAGKLLKKNFSKFEKDESKIKWITNGFSGKKNVTVYSCGTSTAQAKAVSNILNDIEQPGINTAIVLPDDSMLFPVLNSLPERVKRVNVSMGYPLKLSTFHSFIEAYIRLHSNMKSDSSGQKFYYRDVFRIISSRVVSPLYEIDKTLSQEVYKFKKNVTEYRKIYINAEDFPEGIPIFSTIFKIVESVEELFTNLERMIDQIISAESQSLSEFELEFTGNYLQFLRQLRGVLADYETAIDLKTFWKLYMDVIRETRLPFKGEPLEGLQILGLLETRNLGFENIIMLSLNEKVIPGNRHQESFIPFNLRKSFGITSFEDYHDSTSNYFYNAMKEACYVHLFYSSDTKDNDHGEVSRYVTQLETEMPEYNPETTINRLTVDFPHGESGETKVEVIKNDEMFAKFTNGKRILSPSAINYYVSCSLKFYFAYVLGLKEPDEPVEEIDAKTTGSILHDTMYFLYEDYQGKSVDVNDIEMLLSQSDDTVVHVMKQNHKITDLDSGTNLIMKKIIQKLVKRLLYVDKYNVPFNIVELESDKDKHRLELDINGKKVIIGGKIDRVDEKDGIKRVVDYKTGTVKTYDKQKQTIDDLFSNPDYKEYLQTYIYALMYLNSTGNKNVTATLLGLKNEKRISLKVIETPLTDEELSDVETRLIKLVEEILNTGIKFTQTEDINRCKYCPYLSICGR